MGHDGLQFGVQMIRKFMIISTRICYRSVCNHPFFVGILLLLLFLYRSSPFLFNSLLSLSPVLVCTAVLLGTLLSFGEPKLPLIEEEDEKFLTEIKELQTGSVVNNTICLGNDENIDGRVSELGREIVERTLDEEPLLLDNNNVDHTVGELDVGHSSMPIDQNSREVEFWKEPIDRVNSESEDMEIEKKPSLDDPKIQVGVDAGLAHDEVYENGFSGKSVAENIEDYKSAAGSVDTQIRDQLDSSTGLWERLGDVIEDSLSPVQNVDVSSSHDEILDNTEVQARNFEGCKSAERSVDAQKTNQLDSSARSWGHSDDVVEDTLSPGRKVQAAVLAQLRNQLESAIGSWNHFDVAVENRSSVARKVQAENSDDYKSAEGSVDTQNSDHLDSFFKAWNQLGFDREDCDDDDDEDGSDSGSDGAESSSPDASMADIIPMLDELHPLLDDENAQTSNLSHQSSVHSDYESDQKEEEVGDIQSDDDQEEEEEEEETQGSKLDREKSTISWTADDQKNLMDLGTSELERNQRLESLIARRRARRMMVERNLIDLDSMDLQFQVAPISTTRRNPFDLPHDSYEDLGLPPIPGSAPSIMMPRRNPFDLPYDSSEEKPDLMGDSFQQEFMELYYQGEASNLREAVFRRNETFSMGSSSAFNFGTRASRFRPYFVPEKTDSDMMSYASSLQRQSSELSESKASSAPEIESPYADRDGEGKKRDEHEFGQGVEPGSENDQSSLLAEPGSQSSDDLHSLSDKERDFVLQVPEIELGRAGNSPAEVSNTFDTRIQPEASMEERHCTSSSSSSTPKEYSDLRVGDVNEGLVNWELSQADNTENVDMLVNHHLLEPQVSDIPSEHSLEASDFNHGTENIENVSQADNVENFDMLVKHSLEAHVSDISSEHSLEAPDFNHGTEFGDDLPKEPVYDSSPHAIKKNPSSSIFSDFHIERSEIHLCQVSSVGRELLMTEESKLHEDAEQCGSDEKHGVDGNDQVLFSEVSNNSESSVVPEYELHSSVDSPEIELVEDKSSDNNVPQDEERLILNKKDDEGGVYTEGKLDTIENEDDQGSAIHEKSSEDPILTSKDRDSSIMEYSVSPVQSELVSLAGGSREETRTENEEEQQFLESSSNLVNHDNDMVQKLVSALDESLDFPYDSAIDCPNDNPEEQESSIIHSEVEEVGQVNNVYETSNIFAVEGPTENISPDPLQNNQSSFKHEEFKDKSVAELDNEEHLDNDLFQDLGVSLRDEKIPDDFTNDMNKIEENFLSELDVVGDFSANMSINDGFDLAEQVMGESNPNSDNSTFDDTLLRAIFDPQNFEPVTEITEPNFTGFEESNLDSHGGEYGIGLPVLEAQPAEHVDAEFRIVNEEGVQNSDIVESMEAELIRELLEASLETEFLQEDIEPGARIEQDDVNSEKIVESEAKKFDNGEALEQAPEAETEVESVEPPPLHVNRDFIKMPEFSVVDASVAPAMESSAQVEETFGFSESEPLMKDSEIEGIQESPAAEGQIERFDSLESPVIEDNIVNAVDNEGEVERVESLESLAVEESVIPSSDSEDQIEGVGSTGAGPSLIDRGSIVPAIDSEDHQETAASFESEPLPIDSDVNGMPESPLVEEIVPSFETEEQTERFGLVESESLLIDTEEAKGVQELHDDDEASNAPSIGASLIPSNSDDREGVDSVELEASLLDEGLKEVQEPPSDEESIEPSFKSEDQLEEGASLESESPPDAKEMQELHVDRDIVCSIQSEDQTEIFESPDVDREVKEVQESPSDGRSVEPSFKSEDQVEESASLESEPLPIDSDAKEIHESHVDTEIVPSIESKDQTERFESPDVDREVKEVQQPPVVETNVEPGITSSDGSHPQTKVAPHVEVVQVQAPDNNEFASQKQSHGESHESHLEFSSSDSGED